MQEFSQKLRRLSPTSAIIAGAAFLAASAASAGAQTNPAMDEMAMAVPRIAPHGGDAIGLPQPLAPSTAAQIRRIFALQEQGRMQAAASATRVLADTRLLGHILADRYLRAPQDVGLEELRAWCARYNDLPDAPAIRALLLARQPKLDRMATLGATALPDAAPVLLRNPGLDSTIHARASAGHAEAALGLLARTRGLNPLYNAQLQAEIARALFAQGQDAAAQELAAGAFGRSGGQVALAGYVAGLVDWRLGRFGAARHWFGAAAQARLTTPGLQAASAFWAARAALRDADPAAYAPLMQSAAAADGFYALLARRILGMNPDALPASPVLSAADLDAVAATTPGLRGFALLQVGQKDRAADELRQLLPQARQNAALARALRLVAHKAGLDDVAAEIAALPASAETTDAEALPHLAPRGGFLLDPALIYALTRLESNFDATATSHAGARGLMQIMPTTARYVVAGEASGALSDRSLHNPAVNLQIGQHYLLYLAAQKAIGGDMIRLLASYNAGPARLQLWAETATETDDPLLFIEEIPFDETRHFVKQALAFTWIYAARLGLKTASLDQLAAGSWPKLPAGKAEFPTASVRLH